MVVETRNLETTVNTKSKKNISVAFGRNDSHPSGMARRELGPFEWVKITYQDLWVSSQEAEPIAYFVDGYWELVEDESTWSDIIIGQDDQVTTNCGYLNEAETCPQEQKHIRSLVFRLLSRFHRRVSLNT
jgi:hypothetical protein